MKTTITISCLLAMLASLTLSAQETPRPAAGGGFAERFKQLDRDSDGKVSREEGNALTFFNAADKDRDGFLTTEEVQAYFAAQRQPKSANPPAATAPSPPVAASRLAQPDGFVVDDVTVGEPGISYADPEFLSEVNRMVFQTGGTGVQEVWIAELNPLTGLSVSATGKDLLVDTNAAKIGPQFDTTNGPEWGLDSEGSAVFYSKRDADGVMQCWSASNLVQGGVKAAPLTRLKGPDGEGAIMVIARKDASRPTTQVIYRYIPAPRFRKGGPARWADETAPNAVHDFPQFNGAAAAPSWIEGTEDFVYAKFVAPGESEIARFNTASGTAAVLTSHPGTKSNIHVFKAPELNGELLVGCVMDRTRFTVFRSDGTRYVPWADLVPPDSEHPYMISPEIFQAGGMTYLAVQMSSHSPGSLGVLPQDVDCAMWILGLGTDASHRVARRVDEGAVSGAKAYRFEPEVYVGANEAFVYYNVGNTLHRALTGIKVAPAPATKQDFTVEDVRVSPPGLQMVDPEFNDVHHRVAYWDYAGEKLNISVAELDPRTGLLKNAAARDFAVAEDVSPCFKDGRWWSHNGPEWGRDRNGWAIYFTKEDLQGNRQMWRAVEKDGRYVPEPLTTKSGGHCGALISQSATAADTRMVFYINLDLSGQDTVAWARASMPDEFHPLPDWRGSHSIARIVGEHHIGYAPRDKAGVPQVVLLDTRTDQRQIVTDEPGDKFDTYVFRAPEFGGELLMMANIDRQRLAIYRDVTKDGRPWQKIAELRLPQDSHFKYIYSCEPIAPETGVNGTSYFSLNATKQKGANRGETGRAEKDGSIWVFGLGNDPANRLVRRVDEGAVSGIQTTRYESESFVGAEEVFIYYERKDPGTGHGEVRRCRTGISVAGKSPATPNPQPMEKS